jgi:Protein of unknown function (DUF3341)
MTAVLLATFPQPQALIAAARASRDADHRLVDAYSPYPLDELTELLDAPASRLRLMMLIGGVLVAAIAFGTEYYTAVIDYPYNSGGRPLNSWPTFMLVPFATGILGATIAGFITFLVETGLPRLHHPLFEFEGFARASQDGFLLAFARPEDETARLRAKLWLQEAGATAVWEAET